MIRRALITAVSIAVTAIGLAIPAQAADPDTSQIFTPDAWVRTPIPADAPLDPNSAAGISYIQTHDSHKFPYIRGVSDAWGQPFAEATCADPVWKFAGTVQTQDGFLKTEGFHMPTALSNRITGTSDSPITVIDRCGVPSMPNGLAVWGFQASKSTTTPNTINVNNGMAYDITSNGLDRGAAGSNGPRNRGPRGNIVGDDLIRYSALQAGLNGANGGTLGYRPEMFWWETLTTNGHVWPMVGHESGKAGWGPEGIVIRIDPAKVFPSTCTGASLVIAKTLQVYGAMIGDNAGAGGSAIKVEQTAGTGIAPPVPGMSVTMLGNCVTWADFQFMARTGNSGF